MTDAAAEPAPPSAAAFELRLDGHPLLRGQHWGDGPVAALLLHPSGADLDAWGPLPALLAHQTGAAVVALDLPGHGLSDDPWQPEHLPDLLAAVVAALAEPRPPAVVAAGDTAAAALREAVRIGPAALVALSPTLPVDTFGWERSPTVPKLLVAGALDGDALPRCRQAANTLGGWAVVVSVPTADHGTGLLAGDRLGTVAEHAAAFLREALTRSH